MKHAEKVLIKVLAGLTVTLFAAGCSLLEVPVIPEYSGTKRALVYGVADYALVNDLTYTYHDAVDMDNYLSQAGFEVTLRTNSAVTKAQILQDLQDAALTASEDDLLIFHFSGHGDGYLRNYSSFTLSSPFIEEPQQYAGQPALIPDIASKDGSQLIYAEELLEMLAPIPGKKLLLLDICHGGGFVYDDGITVDGLPKDYEYRDEEESTPAFLRAWEQYLSYDGKPVYPDIWVMTSAGAHEEAWESSSVRNGFFTYYLLESLGFDHEAGTVSQTVPADADGNNLVTVSEIYAETFSRFQDGYDLHNNDEPYYPHLSGGSDDLILFHPGDLSR